MNTMTIEQCADLLQVKPGLVRRWIDGGLIQARQDSSISSRALDVFIDRQRQVTRRYCALLKGGMNAKRAWTIASQSIG